MPSCAAVDVSPRIDTEVTATLTASDQPWFLPVCFNVTITSSDSSSQARSFRTKMNNIRIPEIQHLTAYNITVIPCNSFGCNDFCQHFAAKVPALPTEGTAHCVH